MIRIQRANKIIEVNVHLKPRNHPSCSNEPPSTPSYVRDRLRNTVRSSLMLGHDKEHIIYNAQKTAGFNPENAKLAEHFCSYELAG